MDIAVKESIELIVELFCASAVLVLLSFAMYAGVITRLLERLF